MLSARATHKKACDANGFAGIGDLLIEFGLVLGDLRLLLFQAINRSEKLSRLVLCMRRPYHGGIDNKQTDQADEIFLHCERPA